MRECRPNPIFDSKLVKAEPAPHALDGLDCTDFHECAGLLRTTCLAVIHRARSHTSLAASTEYVL